MSRPPASQDLEPPRRALTLVPEPGTALYVHLPYCVAKCTYCDFYSLAAEGEDVAGAVDALLAEARARAPEAPRTVFFGGGTPSLLEVADLERLLDGLDELTGFRGSATEVTLECNPESLDAAKARRLVELGVTRLSIGVQSLDPRLLRLFGRVHSVAESLAAIDHARAAGPRSVGVDLIYGAPGQRLGDWLAELERILSLRPDHVSAYNLAYEEGTLLTKWAEEGGLERLSNELELAFFEATRAALGARGYEAYEVSNFSLNGHRCAHNVNYWRNGAYVGLGPSAVSKLGFTRFGNPRSVTAWKRAVHEAGNAIAWEETPPAALRLGETWWLGLRTREGVDPGVARRTAGHDPGGEDAAEDLALELASHGLLERSRGAWHLSPRGLPLADAIARRFLEERPEPARATVGAGGR